MQCEIQTLILCLFSPPKSSVRMTTLLRLNMPRTQPRAEKRKLWLCGQASIWLLAASCSLLSPLAPASCLLGLLLAPCPPSPCLRPPPDLLRWLLRDLLLLARPPLPAARRRLQTINSCMQAAILLMCGVLLTYIESRYYCTVHRQ